MHKEFTFTATWITNLPQRPGWIDLWQSEKIQLCLWPDQKKAMTSPPVGAD